MIFFGHEFFGNAFFGHDFFKHNFIRYDLFRSVFENVYNGIIHIYTKHTKVHNTYSFCRLFLIKIYIDFLTDRQHILKLNELSEP